MRSYNILLIVVLSLIIITLFISQYVTNIYEVTYNVSTYTLYADNSSECKIETEPINGLGYRVPFRNSPTFFEIKIGRELVEIVKNDYDNGILIIRAKDKKGKVEIYCKSIHALLPSVFEIEILPNFAYLKK